MYLPTPILTERYDSRTSSFDSKAQTYTAELRFNAIGTDDEQAIHTLVRASVPAFYTISDGIQTYSTYLASYQLEPRGAGVWDVTARYVSYEPLEVEWRCDTTGGIEHITFSLKTIDSYVSVLEAEGTEAPDFGGAIGVSGDTIQGLDIHHRQKQLTASMTLPRELWTQFFQETIDNLTGTVNEAPWRTYAKGEALYLGAEYVDRSNSPTIPITHKFSIRKNRTYEDLELHEFPGFTVEGWQAIWMLFRDEVASNPAAKKTIVKKPYAMYIEQVYHYGDFNLLGLL